MRWTGTAVARLNHNEKNEYAATALVYFFKALQIPVVHHDDDAECSGIDQSAISAIRKASSTGS